MQPVVSAVMEQRVRSLQIIVGAMFIGATIFLVIAFLIEPQTPRSGPPLITYVGLAYGALALIARFLLPDLFVRGQWNRLVQGAGDAAAPAGSEGGGMVVNDASALANLFATIGILRAALIEGASLLLILAHLIERTNLSLAAAGVALVILAASVPTQAGARTWFEVQQRRLEAARAAGS